MKRYILVINPGSTSTKVAIYEGEEELASYKINHNNAELKNYKTILEQYDYRLELIDNWLEREKIDRKDLKAVVGRGGLLKYIPGGTYIVTDEMLKDLKAGVGGQHASNLGGILAKGIADKEEIKSYIVDPVSVDEFLDLARISGLKEIERKSQIHALNTKAVSHRRSNELGIDLEELNFIVAHLGGGISISSVRAGQMIDVNNANEMGPFSPERAGGLPVGELVDMCYCGECSEAEMKEKIQGKGGLMSYLETVDAIEVENRIQSGDKYAKLIYDAMIYQIAKEIGIQGTVSMGRVDDIILTGGLAHSEYLVKGIEDMVDFIANIVVYPGEDEMYALNKGVLRVLNNEEKPKVYEEEV